MFVRPKVKSCLWSVLRRDVVISYPETDILVN